MLRVKNVLPNIRVIINPSKIINCKLSKIEVHSFTEKVSSVNKCLKIILWAYHLCVSNNHYQLALEVPLTLRNEEPLSLTTQVKAKTLRFDLGFYDTKINKYTHFIEYDGHDRHYSDVKMIANDILKERFCDSLNVKLLRVSNKYELNYKELDFWFYSNPSNLTYLSPTHYRERNELISRLQL